MTFFLQHAYFPLLMKNLILLLFLAGIQLCYAQQDTVRKDTSLIKKSLFVIPIGYYQPETTVALGIAGGYYFKSNDIQHISSISYSAIYTFNNQFILSMAPKLYSKDKKMYFLADVGWRNYPDYYYGIGNKSTTFEEPFVSNEFSFNFQPQRYISRSWLLGLQLSVRTETTNYDKITPSRLADIFSTYNNYGWNPYFMMGVGALVSYNTRDNFFYPEKGIFAKLSYLHYPKWLSSSYDVSSTSFEFRHYISAWKGHVIAYQLLADAVLGAEIPFQMLPTVGGRDKLRGFREGMYRDNLRFMLQAEYRIPIYKRLKGTIFCSVGDVLSASAPHIDKLKVGYGIGLRYQLNDARVHLRVDYARTNYNGGAPYITASEAF